MNRLFRARLLAAGALLACVTLAQAQYMWIDEKGLKQFSDRAPPASVPLKNILKAPRGIASAQQMPAQADAAAPVAAMAAAPAMAAPPAATPKAAPTLAERDADYRKRAKESGEREQKDKDEQSAGADRADNCERMRAAKRTLASGVRIRTQDKNGERGIMNDEQRAAEERRADKNLADCK